MKNLTFLFFMVSFFISCQKEINCNEAEISNTISFKKESNYLPQKGKLEFFEKELKTTESFNSIELSMAQIKKEELVLLFKNMPRKLKTKYNYRIILDDSLIYNITNIQMEIDTMGKTMGGWAIGCKLLSFEVNKKRYIPNNYNALDFPFSAAEIIKKN